MRKGFRRVILRKGRTTLYRRGKKYAGAILERRRLGKKKKAAGQRRLRAERVRTVRTDHGSQTGRSNRGPNGSMLFSHGTVPYLKQTVNLNGSRVFQSDHTVWSEFNNLVHNTHTYPICFASRVLPDPLGNHRSGNFCPS